MPRLEALELQNAALKAESWREFESLDLLTQ